MVRIRRKKKSTCEDHQERILRDTQPYNFEECSSPMWGSPGETTQNHQYPGNLSAHQRTHRNERPFVCPMCHKLSINPQNSEFLRSYTSHRSLSHVAHDKVPSNTWQTWKLMREFIQKRCPKLASCVFIASASHPHTTITWRIIKNQTDLCFFLNRGLQHIGLTVHQHIRNCMSSHLHSASEDFLLPSICSHVRLIDEKFDSMFTKVFHMHK